MRRVIIESPFAGDIERNQMYARFCSRHSVRGYREAPYASHLYYTQEFILDDEDPDERRLGIEAGLVWGEMAEASVVYVDLGISDGMCIGIERAWKERRMVTYRNLSETLWSEFRWYCIQREYEVPIDPKYNASEPNSDMILDGIVRQMLMEKAARSASL